MQKHFYSVRRKSGQLIKATLFKMLRKGQSLPRTRYINVSLLKALGEHCKRLRINRGYSIDRMAKESDQLSPSVIHRLETGVGAVTITAIFRYSQVLQVPPKQLLDFPLANQLSGILEAEGLSKSLQILPDGDPKLKRLAFSTHLPLYSLKAAAGYFGLGTTVDKLGWVDASSVGKLEPSYFVVQAVGNSMQPKIQNGDYLVFRANPTGTRQGKIVLAQYRGPNDPDTGGSFTVKRYSSVKITPEDEGQGWRYREITLSPLNPEFEPIVLKPQNDGDFRIIAELVGRL